MCSGAIRIFSRCSSALWYGYSVDAEVLLRELVDLRVGAVGRHLRATVDRNPLVVIVRVDDDERDALIVLEMPRLRAPGCRVERRGPVVDIDPDDRVVAASRPPAAS